MIPRLNFLLPSISSRGSSHLLLIYYFHYISCFFAKKKSENFCPGFIWIPTDLTSCTPQGYQEGYQGVEVEAGTVIVASWLEGGLPVLQYRGGEVGIEGGHATPRWSAVGNQSLARKWDQIKSGK